MARKTIEEQLKALEEKEQVLKARKQQLISKTKEQERKARTKRLIEVGAAVEAALGYPLDTEEMRSALMDFLKQQEQRGDFVSKAVKGEQIAVPKNEQ